MLILVSAHTKSTCEKGRINYKWWQKKAPAQKVLVLTDTHYLPIVLLFHWLDLLDSGIDLASESPQISGSLDLNSGLLPLTFEEGFAPY